MSSSRKNDDQRLASIIDGFLQTQSHRTINQTTYPALATRPASMFIETKTTQGIGSRSQAQLGTWAAAWFLRLRAVKSSKPPIAIPLIQVYGNVWNVLFAIDQKDKIVLVDQTTHIGDTASIMGMYQLLAALRVIGRWADNEFRTWIGEFLESCEKKEMKQAMEL